MGNLSNAQIRDPRRIPRPRAGAILLAVGFLLAAALILVLAVSWLSRGPSSEEVVEAFREDGLEVGEVYPIEKQEGPSPGVRSRLPGTYEEGTRFEIPSLGEDAAGRDLGGRVFTFESEEDLAEVRDFYEGLGEAGGPFFSWVFAEGNVLIQISGKLPEEGARRYEAILEDVARRLRPNLPAPLVPRRASFGPRHRSGTKAAQHRFNAPFATVQQKPDL